jgi:hypothetical protein
MGCVVWLLLLISLFFFGTTSTVQMPPPSEPTMQIDHTIESVDALILESYPMQLQLHVIGYHDGCDYPTQVEQSITGNTINVRIFREMPLAVACPAIAVPYDETIVIDGAFTGGAYTIIVNNITTQVDFGGELPTATPFGVPTGANLVVEEVVAINQSAAPATVIIRITGYFDDACDLPIMASQSREGNTFNISLSREIPPNVRCAAGPTPFTTEVTLSEQLMEGTYTVNVNGVSVTFMVP